MVLRHSKTAATRASTTESVTCGASPCAARDSRTMTRTLSRSICLASFGSPTRSAMVTCPSVFRLGRQAWRFRHTDVGSRAKSLMRGRAGGRYASTPATPRGAGCGSNWAQQREHASRRSGSATASPPAPSCPSCARRALPLARGFGRVHERQGRLRRRCTSVDVASRRAATRASARAAFASAC